MRRPRTRLRHHALVSLVAVLGALPSLLTALWLLGRAEMSVAPRVTTWVLLLLSLGTSCWWVRARVLRPWQALGSLLASLREGDFSSRAALSGAAEDPVRGALQEANHLADALQQGRLEAHEAGALLRRVMEAIDVVVLAFDGEGRLRLCNPTGEAVLGQAAERLLGQGVASLRLAECLQGPVPRTVHLALGNDAGPWELRRAQFRLGGLTHTLLTFSNLRRALREEERAAWQRLIRVMGHEINNSMAPISSVAQSLLAAQGQPGFAEDLKGGLELIARRASALTRLMAGCVEFSRLPAPSPRPVMLSTLVEHASELMGPSSPVAVQPGPTVELHVDADQVEQVLINLLKNAAEANAPGAPAVEVTWTVSAGRVCVCIADRGPGVHDVENLFVPFFTTKPGGSGVGLALSRQIAEMHGGSLQLQDRTPGPGACALLTLPVRSGAKSG